MSATKQSGMYNHMFQKTKQEQNLVTPATRLKQEAQTQLDLCRLSAETLSPGKNDPQNSLSTPWLGRFRKTLCALSLALLGAVNVAEAGESEIVFFYNDALGSAVAAVNEDAELCWIENYTPYGDKNINDDVFTPAGTGCGFIGEERGFTGHTEDVDSDLVYMQQRYYDPSIGRFLSIDPLDANPLDPRTYNRYAYANNNPYRYIDPDGRLTMELGFASRVGKSKFLNRSMGVAFSGPGRTINSEDPDEWDLGLIHTAIPQSKSFGTSSAGFYMSIKAGDIRDQRYAGVDITIRLFGIALTVHSDITGKEFRGISLGLGVGKGISYSNTSTNTISLQDLSDPTPPVGNSGSTTSNDSGSNVNQGRAGSGYNPATGLTPDPHSS